VVIFRSLGTLLPFKTKSGRSVYSVDCFTQTEMYLSVAFYPQQFSCPTAK